MFTPSLLDDEELKQMLSSEAPKTPTLQDVYGSDLSDEKLSEIENKGRSTTNTIGDVLAGLGDAISTGYGAGKTNFLAGNIDARNEAKREAVKNFLLKRREKQDALKFGQEQEKFGMDKKAFETEQKSKELQISDAERKAQEEKDKLDPASSRSVMAFETVKKFAPKFAPLVQGKSASEIETTMPWIKNQMDKDFEANQKALEREKDVKIKEMDISNKKQEKENEAKKNPLSLLPEEEQSGIKALAQKNAAKIAIANQIDAVMGNWDSLSDDQKVTQGRQLLKVLNSTEGADAIGKEEAQRLGANLEFATGNVFSSNPLQLGRDLPGFKKQASDTSSAIRSAVKANEDEIDRKYKKYGVSRGGTEEQPKTVKRKTKDGKIAVFDENTKQFLRYE